MSQNTRAFCDQPDNDHALVPQIIELRDNLGPLAVQVLAAREDLSKLSYGEMLTKLYEIIDDLHAEYLSFREHEQR